MAIACSDRDGGQGEALGGPRRECGVYAEPEPSVNRTASTVVGMSLFKIALFASALVMIVAIYAGGRRPERRRRYMIVGSLIVAGCWAGAWWLANALCCY